MTPSSIESKFGAALHGAYRGKPHRPLLDVATKRAVRGVEDALAHYSLDGDNMHASLEALRELIDTDKIILYSLEHGVARSSSNATIAAELKVAERTVEAHVTAILEKAHVPSRAALTVQIFA